jgi:RsiW-degrading membrane proteinase PrsW (M82 family)
MNLLYLIPFAIVPIFILLFYYFKNNKISGAKFIIIFLNIGIICCLLAAVVLCILTYVSSDLTHLYKMALPLIILIMLTIQKKGANKQLPKDK